jgi:hypothetical protein
VLALRGRDSNAEENSARAPGADDGRAGAAALTQQGYALLHWRDAGFDYWAVTDASPPTLTAFHRAWEASEASGDMPSGKPARTLNP